MEVWKSTDNFVELACWDLQRSRLLSRYQTFRLHDSGDFLSRLYFLAWTRIAKWNPNRIFYAYTKSLSVIVWDELPPNMIIVQSYDEETTAHLIQWDRPVAKIFRTLEELRRNTEGYVDATHSDNPVLAGAKRLGLVYHPQSRLETGKRTGPTPRPAWQAGGPDVRTRAPTPAARPKQVTRRTRECCGFLAFTHPTKTRSSKTKSMTARSVTTRSKAWKSRGQRIAPCGPSRRTCESPTRPWSD